MVNGLLDAEGTHEAGTAVHTPGHHFLQQIAHIAQYQVPQPAVVSLHHIGPVSLRLPVVVILPGQERLVVRTQLAVTVVIGYPPHHAVPCPHQHIFRQLVHTQVELYIQVVGGQVGKVEILPGFRLEGRAHPFGRRELVAVILIVHPVKGVRLLVIGQILAGRRFLHAFIKETHHAVKRLVHLVVLVTGAQVFLDVRFFFGITSAIVPEHVFRMVELETAVKVEIHEVRMVGLRGRQPAEQAQVVRVVQRLDADGQVFLRPVAVRLQVVQRITGPPLFFADGLVLAEYRVAVALLVVHVVLAVVGQILIHTLCHKQVTGQAVNGRAYVFLARIRMVGGILLGRGQDTHFLHAVMDELRATGVGGHGGVRKVTLRTGEFRPHRVVPQSEQVLLTLRSCRVALLPVTVYLAVAHPCRVTAGCLLEVEAQVLAGIVHRTGTLDTQINVTGYPVQRPVLTVVESNFPAQLVGLLVVQLGQRIHHVQRVALAWHLTAHAARAYQYQDRVPPLLHQSHQLLHAHRVPLVQHAVVLIQRTHAQFPVGILQMVAVHDVVVKHLVRSQRLVIDAHALHVQVSPLRFKLQLAPDVEVHLVQPLRGGRLLPVHIEADQRPLLVGLHVRIEHVSDADILTGFKLRTHRVLIAQDLTGIHRLRHHAGKELRLLRGHHQPVTVAVLQGAQTGDQLRVGVSHVGRAVFYLQRHAHVADGKTLGLVRLVERAITAVCRQCHARTAGQQQAVLVPAASCAVFVHAPQHITEFHPFVPAHPAFRVVFRVASPEGIERAHGIRCQRGFNVGVRCGVHLHLKHGITARHTVIQRFHVHVRTPVAAGLTALQQVFLHHTAPAGHFHTGRVRIPVIAGIREVPRRELLCLQYGVLPVTLEPCRPVVEHHAGIGRHTFPGFQQGQVVYLAHHAGVLVQRIGFHHVHALPHFTQRNGDVLLLDTGTG